MIRVTLVDDHPAIRVGMRALLRLEPGLIPVGFAGTARDALERVEEQKPHVCLVDLHLPDGDGLLVTRQLKRLTPAPRVLIISAFAGPRLAVPAKLAGASGVVGKDVQPEMLFAAIREIAAGGSVLPALTPAMVRAHAKRVDASDLPLFAMAMEDTPVGEIADVLALSVAAVEERLDRMLGVLRRAEQQPPPGQPGRRASRSASAATTGSVADADGDYHP